METKKIKVLKDLLIEVGIENIEDYDYAIFEALEKLNKIEGRN